MDSPCLPRPLLDWLVADLYRLAMAGDAAAREALARLLEGK